MAKTILLLGLAACSAVSNGSATGDAPVGERDAPMGSGSGSAASDFSSGTRIKARTTTTTITSTDGAKYSAANFGGWFDSMRNEACAPSVASDGMTRCLPSATAVSTNNYADAACTIPVVLVVGTCAPSSPPDYVSVPPPATCPPATVGPTLFVAGALTTTYYNKSATTCNGPSTIASFFWYPVSGSAIDPSLFVEMTNTTSTQ